MSEHNQETTEKQVRAELDEETLFLVSQTFKALSDPTRIKILHLLSQGEHSVNEIAEKLSLLQSTVSHQAQVFKKPSSRQIKKGRDFHFLFSGRPACPRCTSADDRSYTT